MITKIAFHCVDCQNPVLRGEVDHHCAELRLCNDCYTNAQLESDQQDEILREQQANYDHDVAQSLRRY
jgi:hypothetical protein